MTSHYTRILSYSCWENLIHWERPLLNILLWSSICLSVSSGTGTEPTSVCPMGSKVNHWDIRFASRKEFIPKAAKWRDRRTSIKSASNQIRSQKRERTNVLQPQGLRLHTYQWKGWGEFMIIHEARYSMHIEQTYIMYIPMFTLGWRFNNRMRQNTTLMSGGYLRARRRGYAHVLRAGSRDLGLVFLGKERRDFACS